MGILNYSDDEVKTWLKDKTPDQIAKQAASMGLNASQIQQGLAIGGQNVSANQISDYARSNGYNFGGANEGLQTWNANAGANLPTTSEKLPADAAAAQNMMATNAANPNLSPNSRISTGNGWGRNLTLQQVRDFAATNPTNEQILEQAAAYGMSLDELATAMTYGRGDTFNTLPINEMINSSSTYGYDSEGRIVATNGQGKSRINGNSMGVVNGTFNGSNLDPNGGAPTPVGNGGAGSAGGSSSGSSSSSGGTSGPGNWQVTPEQTVESRVAGILAAGNPLVEQRRAQSDMKMNARGLVNSSIAQTASDDAAYSAALDIAKPDAATFADAAKTNAMAKTTWGISQNNNQTSRDNTQAQIGAQRELQRATQLYNNLTNQTATATSLQQWGLNTVASIQASDLSAEAKSAAIGTIQQYLADSYQIQGDWHTTAARMIDSIFD